MSAVFEIGGAIIEAIAAIIEAVAYGISAVIEAAPAIFEALAALGSVAVAVAEGLGQGLAAIPAVLEGIGQVVPAQLMAYVLWFAVEAFLIAFLPTIALPITALFFLFTLYGLWKGIGAIIGAGSAVAAILAFVALAVNLYLVLVVG